MRPFLLISVAAALWLCACGGAPQPKAGPVGPARPVVKPADESRRFPIEGRIDTAIVADHLLGKDFLPGGNIARYKRSRREFELFLIRAASPEAAALLLFEYKGKLESPKFIAHFGGYFGNDGNTPAFLFAKGRWLAGVRGLPQADADTFARDFAARLD